MGNERSASPVMDTAVASIARVYDAMLGGKDNWAVDRAVLDALTAVEPSMQVLARDNREWLIRVCRFLAGESGVEQYLDCGSGLPTSENTHQVVQRLNPEARVVYVDNDPSAVAHGRVLLAENDRTFFADADFTEPDRLLAERAAQRLDFTEPIALFQVNTLHHVSDQQDPRAVVQRVVDALPPGSYLAISHFHDPADGSELSAKARELERVMLSGPMGSGRFRTRAEIEALFCGLELVSPGLVLPRDWWPDGPRQHQPLDAQQLILAGLARKP
ncbi:SAM-dependent methyltransferase [Saccharopolyspora griseoalba]|uniref:SAM-dependent methyltransferase n=1 Tax=Saccharopolyspora griseoalba TaxID=1431848 RepID=A0ABW2LTZ2_9PSEU